MILKVRRQMVRRPSDYDGWHRHGDPLQSSSGSSAIEFVLGGLNWVCPRRHWPTERGCSVHTSASWRRGCATSAWRTSLVSPRHLKWIWGTCLKACRICPGGGGEGSSAQSGDDCKLPLNAARVGHPEVLRLVVVFEGRATWDSAPLAEEERRHHPVAMPTMDAFSGFPPIEPRKGTPKEKMPPSAATSQ